MLRNDTYWGPKPAWERVDYRMVTSGPARLSAQLAGDVDFIDHAAFECLHSWRLNHEKTGGKVCVATIINGGITAFDPDGSVEHFPVPDLITTNICFGGPGLTKAYVTLSGIGPLVELDWTGADWDVDGWMTRLIASGDVEQFRLVVIADKGDTPLAQTRRARTAGGSTNRQVQQPVDLGLSIARLSHAGEIAKAEHRRSDRTTG